MRGLSRVEVVYFVAPKRYVFEEHRGSYLGIRTTFKRILASIDDQGNELASATLASIWMDDPEAIPTPNLVSRACVLLTPGHTIQSTMMMDEIPAGKHAKLVYSGPYVGLLEAWRFFYGVWLPHSGERTDGPGFEIYQTRPSQVPDDQLVTELYIPLK